MEKKQHVDEDNEEERSVGEMGRMCFPSAPSGAAFHLRHPEGHLHTSTMSQHASHAMRSSRVNSPKILIRAVVYMATLTWGQALTN